MMIPLEQIKQIKTPAYVIDERKLINNLEILSAVKKKTGCSIILALKAFSMFSTFPLIRKYLDGTTASSLNEARLGKEEFQKNVHIYLPVYREEEMDEICSYASHISFNSFSQWKKYKPFLKEKYPEIEIGLRINPGVSSSPSPLYDPCAPCSRLGVRIEEFAGEEITGFSGFHFHTLCEQNVEPLEKTLNAVEEKFGDYLYQLKWLNIGGGHHITRADYKVDRLCELINYFKEKYDLEIILEPGEAVVLNAGYLVTTVLDIVKNEMEIAILDSSAAAHMPDVIEMPYRPPLLGSGEAGEYAHTYRLTGNSCLPGDVIGDYSFKEPLKVGDKLVLLDMAHYTMVKNNTFNGINLPSIYLLRPDQSLSLVKTFGYADFKIRLS
ncbi:carboxynorspermidine decarboxylase [Candidatus Auribacterota bacterium]